MQLFNARRSEFGAVRIFVESACAKFLPADRQRLILIVEELFSNTIEHGYGGDSVQPVWLALEPTAEGCGVVYHDAAPAYDPFSGAHSPALEMSPEQRPVGGLGIFLIGEFSSSRHYERRDEHNVIELFVPRSHPGAAAKTP